MKKDGAKREEPYVLINDIAKLFGLYVARATERSGLAYGYRKLLMCLAHGEEMPQLQLIEQANLTPATVSSSMAKLEAAGIVARRFDPDDRRKYFVQLTEKGREHCELIHNRSEELGRIMLEGVSEEEKNMLGRVLSVMLENLREVESGEYMVKSDL